MTLSRWRRVVTGVAAGVIVLCAALIGASFRDDGSGVSVASELRPANIIPIEEDPVDEAVGTADDATDNTAVDTTDDVDASADESADEATEGDPEDDAITEPVQVIETDELAEPADDAPDTSASGDTEAEADTSSDDDAADDAAATDDAVDESPQEPAAEPDPTPTSVPQAPLTPTDDSLGTGGGVDDAECALDRLVIYAGARRGGVAGSIRSALAQAGFGAGCPTPVTVLASNCPLQFSGVLGAGSGYDPNKSFVASSDSVDRETMTAVMSTVGYSGNQIDILDFGFVNADRPGEQWMAIFIPPSFDGWQNLAGRAGLSPTTSSLCAASGQLVG